MSIDINWSTFTTGEDGARLGRNIRDFIHDKFQRITLPKFIQSVQVVSFDFGSVAPDIEIKSITDPYPEFYENDDDYDDESDGDDDDDDDAGGPQTAGVFDENYELRIERERKRRERRQMMEDFGDASESGTGNGVSQQQQQQPQSQGLGLGGVMDGGTPRRPGIAGFRSAFSPAGAADWHAGGSTPLFPFSTPTGATSNLHYFHSALSSGFSGGTPSPLPFGSPFGNGSSTGGPGGYSGDLRDRRGNGEGSPSSVGSLSSVGGDAVSLPQSPLPIQHHHHHIHSQSHPSKKKHRSGTYYSDDELENPSTPPSLRSALQQIPVQTPMSAQGISMTATSTPPRPLLREPRDEDMQVIARVGYSGDVRMELTTELLLDYPARSFVSLPVRLVVTGMSFDGLACIAYIGKRLHFCFLEDDGCADAGRRDSGGEGIYQTTTSNGSNGGGASAGVVGSGITGVTTGGQFRGMLKEIKVESEIGEKGKGKQVLKNVGKVERFVLEQVRRIFEEEFVFPSSWTFLV